MGLGLRLGVAVMVTLGLGLGGRSGLAATYRLSVTGDSGARFAGACTLFIPSGEERVELAGPVPLERSFVGQGLACRFETEGRVVVDITGGGSRSRSATNGGTVNIAVR